ncbi:MAG: RNA polymerase sigma factor, partial [Ktedonobacteraceae bacterium]|nr:RNA polymerase sigma factor [Ktedonobacteraceae bacterium]
LATLPFQEETMVSNEELLHEWQQGNVAALEVLVQRCHAPLVAHLYRLLGDAHMAEDIAQETFLNLVRDAHAYCYPRPFFPWFYTIARRLALNYQLSAYRRHTEIGTPLPDVQANEPDPVEWLVRWEQHHELQQALAHLSFEHREILSLRFGQQFSVKEVAELLTIPSGTVKSRTFKALHLLRHYLEQQKLQHPDKRGEKRYG